MGPLEALLGDPEVTRIFIPKPQVVLVERRGKTEVLAAQGGEALNLSAARGMPCGGWRR